jgi:hypothetical protein
MLSNGREIFLFDGGWLMRIHCYTVAKFLSYECLGNSAAITVDAATLQIIHKKDLGLD